MVTVFGFLMHVPIAFLVASGHNLWAAVLLVIFGLLDTLDGQLAQLQKRESARGMLLDSATDRMKEVLLYIGAAYAFVYAASEPKLAIWAVVAVGCSLLVSYMNAWGDAVAAKYGIGKHAANKAFRGGLMPFEIRMAVFVAGLLSGHLGWAVIIVAIGSAFTAFMRLLGAYERLGKSDVQS